MSSVTRTEKRSFPMSAENAASSMPLLVSRARIDTFFPAAIISLDLSRGRTYIEDEFAVVGEGNAILEATVAAKAYRDLLSAAWASSHAPSTIASVTLRRVWTADAAFALAGTIVAFLALATRAAVVGRPAAPSSLSR